MSVDERWTSPAAEGFRQIVELLLSSRLILFTACAAKLTLGFWTLRDPRKVIFQQQLQYALGIKAIGPLLSHCFARICAGSRTHSS
jgi:hypothetical protein